MEKTRQWERVKELFDAALQRPASERGEFLREACGPDSSLLKEVESLLSAYERSDGLSDHPFAGESEPEAQTPLSIGPYHLIRKIGEGGMGQVWLAEQSAPLERQVALKLIRAGMYDDALLRRFQAERQSLALMDHPAIAKVFDAGATADGQPYFVMEYVPGKPITDYCDHKKLNIRERLELFVKACEGVQHAHQKAIIHRDLKPANILVVELDGKPSPRLIDFGLAKAVTPLAAGESLFTRVWGFVGTPGYMSPEQADPNAEDVDTRTDVYSLGVILYELLTGLLPFDTGKWRKQPLDQVLRQLREQDPPRPSDRLLSQKESSAAAAELRGTELKPLSRLLRGDLDCITMKALEKDRARRYGSPSELAADIERYLHHEPVVARPASAGYRVQKYVRRHRVAVGVAAVLVLLLAGFAGLEAVQLRRMTEERDRTARERDRANRIADFAMNMFRVSDPSEARGNTVTAREILDKASKNIETSLTKDPGIQAQMMYVMGRTYQGLGLFTPSESLLRKAIEIQERIGGKYNPELARPLADLGMTLMYSGHYAEAEQVDRQSLEIALRAPGQKQSRIIDAKGTLGGALLGQGKYEEAEKTYREVLDLLRTTAGPDDRRTIGYMGNLALAEYMEGRYVEEEALQRQVLERSLHALGPNYPNTLRAKINLVLVLTAEGKFAEAERTGREALDDDRRVLGPAHPVTASSMQYLANALRGEGKFEEGEKLDREVLDIRRKSLGAQHSETLASMDVLAGILMDRGQFGEAEKLERQVVAAMTKTYGADYPDTCTYSIHLAAILEKEGRSSEAENMDRQALDPAQRALGTQSISVQLDLNTLALTLAHEGRYAEAEHMAKQALDVESHQQMPKHVNNKYSSYYLACIAAIQGRKDEAFSLLNESIDHGLWPEAALTMANDPDLKSLHSDARFAALIVRAKEQTAAG